MIIKEEIERGKKADIYTSLIGLSSIIKWFKIERLCTINVKSRI